ncbi:histidine utilization repressor [Aureimonas populi]|uniref:Histidine utilization repressor n=1 Tax=Aureimonas populi TaxID=1701758 RepID=A0ABW5CMZ4_9HYPH|nr:histidine utilization repressor [Aureimonas populi]
MTRDRAAGPAFALEMEAAGPLYERLKAEIRRRIDSGAWPVHHRLPSENELVEALGVSRMTAHRALRELASEGAIVRVRGKGSFVAPRKRSAPVAGVRNIAEEIAERGSAHSALCVLAQAEIAGPDLAEALEIGIGAPVFHSLIVHREDDLPIQLEDRHVNPAIAPGYLEQDFAARTPHAYLTQAAPITRSEQFVEAVLPQAWECRLLAIARGEPCLLVRRRTWSSGVIVTRVRLLYPGTRYRLESSD